MPSPTEDIFQEIAKDFNIRWNFPNCVGSNIATSHLKEITAACFCFGGCV